MDATLIYTNLHKDTQLKAKQTLKQKNILKKRLQLEKKDGAEEEETWRRGEERGVRSNRRDLL